MSRGLWFVAGAGAGVYAMVRGRRAAEALSPDGLRDRAGAVALGARMFRDEVAQGRAEAETDLRRRLAASDPRALESQHQHDTQHQIQHHHPEQEGTS
ncbi:hypothetical protein I601_2987 [Nocardioides dokdonensis FR1436]|uniref:Uncharacterized protein n=1 Tax=Nocardioides dokdonensis FR1436 TaxID=1300347 RepID=A0A1A9GM86_9ACTN|nr:DUF6167 family protein [Nocardioides dokdonensis]ANH39398.1 hypothetical protein I601_2987 [Nocardioides dokdonensis FR1436]